MLTSYSNRSSLKKKITVVVIWLVALVLSILFVEAILYEGVSFKMKIFPAIIGIFMIAGILLRCKFARAFTLVTLYVLALFPFIANFLLGDTAYILFFEDIELLFTETERLLTNILWALIVLIPIYFLSNNKSMEIFYIQSNPIEHVLFALAGLGICVLYVTTFL